MIDGRGESGADGVDVRRFAGVLSDAAVGLTEISPSGRIFLANDEMCRIVGRSAEETRSLTIAELVHPEDRASSMRAVAEVAASGVPRTIGKRYLRPDGTVVSANCSIARALDGGGDHILVATRDLTDDLRARTAMSDSERRFREFAEASPNVIWVRDAATFDFEFISDAVEGVYGIAPGVFGSHPRLETWIDIVLPTDRPTMLGALASGRAGGKAVADYRIRRPSDGCVRWIRSTVFPMLDETGAVRRIGGISSDVTSEKAEYDARSDLLSELQHRARNIMSVVRNVVRRSSRTADDLPDFVSHLEGRLGVLARTQNLLTRDVDARVDLETLVRDEMRVQTAPEGFLTATGPRIDLGAREAEVVAQAVHELATNCQKYGSLSRPDGRLAVSWTVDASQVPAVLRVVWTETGAPSPVVLARRGFGLETVEQRLPYDLGGEGSVRALPRGIVAEISFTLAARDASADASDGGTEPNG